MSTMTQTNVQVYAVFIKASPEQIWEAITKPEFTSRYFYGSLVDSTFEAGAPYRSWSPDREKLWVDGEVLDSDPPRRLVIRWRNEFKPELKAAGYSRCTMEIGMADYYPHSGGKAVKLTITHEAEVEQGAPLIEAVSCGWPKVLSNLKSLLETGDVAFQI